MGSLQVIPDPFSFLKKEEKYSASFYLVKLSPDFGGGVFPIGPISASDQSCWTASTGQSSDQGDELSVTAADGSFWEWDSFIGSVLIQAVITKSQIGENLKGEFGFACVFLISNVSYFKMRELENTY